MLWRGIYTSVGWQPRNWEYEWWKRLASASFGRRHAGIELCGLPTRHTERFPSGMVEVLRQKDDLPYVVSAMAQRAVNSLHYGMRLATNKNGARHVFFIK